MTDTYSKRAGSVDDKLALSKEREQMWTRWAVNPTAVPLARRIARTPWITPNRITMTAAVVALAGAACFATGQLRLGGLLFIVRFYIDCLDGKVARAQGSSSHRGAALDLIVDVAGIGLNLGALSWYLVSHHLADPPVTFLLMASVIFYNWALAYRKHIADRSAPGDGGSDGRWTTRAPLLRTWVSWCQRVDMNPVPWAVEAEILVLGLFPLLLTPHAVGLGLWLGTCFYLVACVVNGRRVWRIAGALDVAAARLPTNNNEGD